MDKNHELWILKASVEHALKREKIMFVNDIKPYDNSDTKQTELVKKMNEISYSFLETYFRLAGDRGTTQVPDSETTKSKFVSLYSI